MSTQSSRMGRNPFEKKLTEEFIAEAYAQPELSAQVEAPFKKPKTRAAAKTLNRERDRSSQGFTFGFIFEIPLKFLRVGLKSVLVVKYLVTE